MHIKSLCLRKNIHNFYYMLLLLLYFWSFFQLFFKQLSDDINVACCHRNITLDWFLFYARVTILNFIRKWYRLIWLILSLLFRWSWLYDIFFISIIHEYFSTIFIFLIFTLNMLSLYIIWCSFTLFPKWKLINS